MSTFKIFTVGDLWQLQREIIVGDELVILSYPEFKKIEKKYDELYLDEKTADVHFLCGPNLERVPAHKKVLCEASDVFKTMFYGSMAPKEEIDIPLPETSYEGFKDFLKFCYYKLDITSGGPDKLEREMNFEVVPEVMNLGEMFLMPLCVKKCYDAWIHYIYPINVQKIDKICYIYHFVLLLDAPEVRFRAAIESILCSHPHIVWKTSSFINCDHYVLDHLIQLELREYECEIFRACLNWARNACEENALNPNDVKNIRHQLKDSVYKIRYGSIPMSNFQEQISMSDINDLFPNPDDADDVIQLLLGSKFSKTGHFIAKPRNNYSRDPIRYRSAISLDKKIVKGMEENK